MFSFLSLENCHRRKQVSRDGTETAIIIITLKIPRMDPLPCNNKDIA